MLDQRASPPGRRAFSFGRYSGWGGGVCLRPRDATATGTATATAVTAARLASAGAAAGRGCRSRSGVHPCTHSLPRPSMAAATTPPTRRVFGMLCGRRFDRGSVLALTRRQGYRCRPGVPVGAGGTGHASVERRRDPTQPARRAPAGIRRPFRQQAGSYESRSPPVRSPQTKRWPALQSKLRPVSRPRTSWPGGMAPVAHGCATTRVRTGRPPEGWANPRGGDGPVRSQRAPASTLQSSNLQGTKA